jgi:hypothetical protein
MHGMHADAAARPRPRVQGRGPWIAVAIAAVWSVALLGAAATLPAYRSSSPADAPTVAGPVPVTTSSATLVEENGARVLAVVAIPLVVTGLVALALWRRRRAGRAGAGPFAGVLTAVVVAFCVVGALTIGPFVLPVAGALVAACALA